MDWSGKSVLVLGVGRTGRSAAAFLAERGARVVAADEKATVEPLPKDPRVHWCLGEPFPPIRDFDVVVPSPGIPPARFAGAALVYSDVEIAADAMPARVVAVTGSNGKTTTVLLLEAMLRAAGLRAQAGGNLGVPALELVGSALDVAIFEVSSFQLESCQRFRPEVAVALNLSADHLDRHGSFAAYAAAKARLFAHQRQSDSAILNGDDAAVIALARGSAARRRRFSRHRALPDGAWTDAGALVLADRRNRERASLGEVERHSLPARSNVAVESLLATALCCQALGVSVAEAARAWPVFTPPPHRLELVAESSGVRWINDSKATNPGAAQHALEHCEGKAVWIAGGRDKGDLDLSALFETATTRVRAAIWYGEGTEQLDRACAGRFPAYREPDLEAAVARAAGLAQAGDTVLLSPAFASFDQFHNFEERGECFRAAVARHAGPGAPIGRGAS